MSGQQYRPPPGPPPGQKAGQSRSQNPAASPTGGASNLASNNPWRDAQVNPAKRQRPSSSANSPEYEAPPGPPPIRHQKDVVMKDDDYEPPVGPPPSKRKSSEMYEAPPGPPPSRKADDAEPPPYDPWYGGPNEQLRPPPSFAAAHPTNQKSPTANADYDDAKQAHAWCRQNALWRPPQHEARILLRIREGDLRLTEPPNTTNVTLYQPSQGHTYIRTNPYLRDTVFLSDIPVYAAQSDSPLVTGRAATVYFEVRVSSLGDRYNEHNEVESGIAIGFVAPPYPAWRLPGWHRGSLAVHGDDGRRYVDNSYGGQDFTTAFQKGDVVGIGMAFAPPVHGDAVGTRCQVFFTRNGQRDGGWNLHEERDSSVQEGDITGLEGEHDLLAAVGVFGGAELEAIFRRDEWMYKP